MKKNITAFHVIAAFLFLFYNADKSTPLKKPFPIQFAISETKIIEKISQKNQDFSRLIPGNLKTYIYNNERDYYEQYQQSFFALTSKKGGWDCMRHYEILANGCIPYFEDIDSCNPNTLFMFPKSLIKEAMNLEGVSRLKIDHSKFNEKKYYEILNKLLNYTRQYLTTKNMATYLLKTVGYNGNGTILLLSVNSYPNYLRDSILIGLKEIFAETIIDYPKIEHIYTNYLGNTNQLYGKGFSYTKIVEEIPVKRDDIENRIKNKEFDLIIYGAVHHELPFHDLVLQHYPSENIVYMCGEDFHTYNSHKVNCSFAYLSNFFLREFDGYMD